MDGMTVMSMEKVKVAVRVRPFSRREIELATKCVVEMDSDRTSCTLHHHHSRSEKVDGRKPPKNFAFDNCFWSVDDADAHYANQADVYNALGVDILDNAFQGYNACIFAYGQTGSGKSFTMMGTQENKGIIPRLCDNLFERIANNDDENRMYKVEVSYMEIYNEKVHDLLDPKGTKQNLRVREHNILGPYVDGLSTLAVSSFHDIDNLMQEGNKSRTVAATNMNNESSRSHAVFSVILTQTLVDIPSGVTGEKVAKVSLVDLAGSERAVKTGAVGERLKEGSNINKSLTTLGLVISKLADQSQGKAKDNKFVPYRDSVLTWLLKDNLGGNSKTVMVATISPASDNYEETLSTLRYADRAKRIVNHAVINEDPNARIIRELRAEVEALKEQLKYAAVSHRSTKREDLHEKLTESERIMQEMSQTWEQKLLRTERIHHERQHALEKMGISVQASGIKVEQNKYYLVNLNADPSLNELLVYYLKEHTLVGRAEATVQNDIQLSGLGIMPEHCIITIENCELHIEPKEGARTCVNGSVISGKTLLTNGDRVLWGNNHFFRVNCPKPNNNCGFDSDEDAARPIDYEFAREELMMKELSNDPIQSAMKALERQHEEDKQGALEKQRLMFEKQLQMLRNQMSPSTPYSPYVAFDPLGLGKMTPSTPTVQSKVERWAQERDEIFKKSLSKLREDIVKANTLVREANFLAEEMGKQTEFGVTLQIPAANLSPNREPGAFVSEPAIMVKRKHKPSQVWSMEKLENKLIDMREMYEERKEKGLPMKDEGPPKGVDPFYESQDNHNLIGVANLFLEVLLHEVKLAYQVPIISQQGEVAGRLQVEISRVAGNISDRLNESSSEGSAESTHGSNPDISEESAPPGNHITCRVEIKQATGLPPSLSNFVFCHYTFPCHSEPTVAAPVVNPDFSSSQKHRSSLTIKFDHIKEFTVNVTEEFVEHCHDRALSIEVWGHRCAGFGSSHSEWEVDSQLLRSRSLVDRWGELKRKIELWVEIHELNEQGEYSPVEVLTKPDVLTGGVFQLRQGQQRRILLRVKPVQNSGTLPIICEAITSIAVGSVCARSKLQKGLDSYQEEDLNTLREKWTDALTRRREYLGEQIQRIINKQDKTDQDIEREQSLIDQWMSLMEEGNAVLVPSANSGIPGAPADWDPPLGMEKHIPVLFLDLNADDMSTTSDGETVSVVGANLILPKEHGTTSFNLPIVKYCEKDVCAVASWDSSIHDSLQLNRLTPADERVYMILKTTVRLSHPATMELVLRKRLSINVYKKQSLTEKLKKKIGRQELLYSCGVAYEVVSNIPKASEELEDRESLAQMAASGEDTSASDGETYIEKYTRGVSAVESILTLDRLRQEVAVKELLAAQGRPLRKTASVPNISHISRLDSSMGRLDEQFHSESMLDISSDKMDKLMRQRSNNLLGSKCSSPEGKSTGGSPFGLTRPTFLNLNLNLNLRPQAANSKYSYHDPYLSARRVHDFLINKASVSPQAARLIKPMRTVLEEQYQLEAKPLLLKSNQESVEEEEEDEEKETKPNPHKATPSNNVQRNEDAAEEFSEFESHHHSVTTDKETSSKTSSVNTQVKEKTAVATPATSESLPELQSKAEAGTPSTVSSGYGSQAVSSTTLFSEDSISVRSISVDETPDSEAKIFKEVAPQNSAVPPVTTTAVGHGTNDDGEKSIEASDGYDTHQNSTVMQDSTTSSHGLYSDDTVEHHHPTDSANAAPLNELYISEEGLERQLDDSTGTSTHRPTDDGSDCSSENLTPPVQVVKRRVKSVANSNKHRMSYPMTASTVEKLDFGNLSLAGSNCGSDASLTLSFQDDCSGGDDSSFGSRADLNRLNDSPLPDWAVLGESVLIRPYNTSGTIAFIGPTVFANGTWVGVDLDTPSGKNDGSVNGVRYFTSRPRHGIFVRHDKLILDKRGRNMKSRQSLHVSTNSLRKVHAKSEGLSSSMIDVNTVKRAQIRGDGTSMGDGLDNAGWNLRRSRSRGEGLHEVSGNRGSRK